MYKEAVEAYKQAIRIEPDFAEAYNRLGLTYGRDLSMLREAIEAFKHAIRIKPNFVNAYLNLGFAYEKSGMYKEAVEVYKKAGELEPMNGDIHAELADILLKSGDNEQSIREYEKAFKLVKENMKSNPKDASIYGTASWCALFLGDFLAAQQYAKDGISYDPKEYWISCNLGHAYLLQGHKAKAITEYKYFINHSMENPKGDIKEDFSLLKKRFVDKIYIMKLVENELGIK
jgi:tetratricopeptide (TPR) repeat protein